MNYKSQSAVHRLEFCPYEDVLGVGHSGGFSSILIPGRFFCFRDLDMKKKFSFKILKQMFQYLKWVAITWKKWTKHICYVVM